MKMQWCLPVSVFMCVGLVAVMNIRKRDYEKEAKKDLMSDVKLRVTNDVLDEYQSEHAKLQNQQTRSESELKDLEEQSNIDATKRDKLKRLVEGCKSEQKTSTDELAKIETQFNSLKGETEKEMESWTKEVDTLKVQLAARSPVCDFVLKGSDGVSQLCVNAEPPKQEEPKAEAPKQEEPKAEAPKQEEPKADAPKQGEPKAEAPKQEEPKADAPKQGEPKAEAPKQEEPKAEAPKQEEPKAEAPKQEEPKAEAPKQEEPKAEAPKQEEPKADAPK